MIFECFYCIKIRGVLKMSENWTQLDLGVVKN